MIVFHEINSEIQVLTEEKFRVNIRHDLFRGTIDFYEAALLVHQKVHVRGLRVLPVDAVDVRRPAHRTDSAYHIQGQSVHRSEEIDNKI